MILGKYVEHTYMILITIKWTTWDQKHDTSSLCLSLSMVFIFITRRSFYYYYDKYYGVILLLSLFFFQLSFDVSSVIVHHVRRVVAVDLIRQTSLRRELTLTVRHGR